jgi:type VI secretion system protein VasG
MLTVDIKSLLKRLNSYCTSALEGAAGLCVSRTHYEVTVEHVLVKLLENPQADFSLILRRFDLDPGKLLQSIERGLEELKAGNAGKPVFSPLLMEWFQEAWLIASVDLEEARVRSGALLLAFLTRPSQLASGAYVDLLTAISRDNVKSEFWDLVKGSSEKAVKDSGLEAKAVPPGEATALKRFCEDFTAKAASGDIDPVFGRDTEIRQMVDILARRRKNNPIVVGEAGVGKTAVVEGLALRVVEGDVPDMLKDVSIIGLDMGLLQAGAG